MAFPTTYSEATLIDYMHSVIGQEVADLFAWVVATSYEEAFNDALLIYGIDDTQLASVTGIVNVQRLRTAACIAVWRQVVSHATAKFAISADGDSHQLNQVADMAIKNLARCEADGVRMLEGGKIRVGKLNTVQSPYTRTGSELD